MSVKKPASRPGLRTVGRPIERLEDRTTPSAWFTFAGNPQHTGLSAVAAQPADSIHWQTPIDLAPSGAEVHYGSPVFTPANGVAWEIAKVHLQVSDGNHHELFSHLGRTHLVVEAFAMATPRRLAPEHPLEVLLLPDAKVRQAFKAHQIGSHDLAAPDRAIGAKARAIGGDSDHRLLQAMLS